MSEPHANGLPSGWAQRPEPGSRLTPQAVDRLQMRTYGETLRFNITVIDGHRAMVQLYLQHARGLDSPTFVIEASDDEPHGLFPTFERVVTEAWNSGRDVQS